MDKKMRDALNDQVQREFQAAYLYTAMMCYFEDQDLPGFAAWMQAQADEERDHAMRIVDHLHDRGQRVELQALEKPTADYDSPLDAMQSALEHERAVTGHIEDLYELADEKGDYPAQVMLEWFIEEQVEEEDTFGTLVGQLERVGSEGSALLMLDSKLGDRGGA